MKDKANEKDREGMAKADKGKGGEKRRGRPINVELLYRERASSTSSTEELEEFFERERKRKAREEREEREGKKGRKKSTGDIYRRKRKRGRRKQWGK